MNSVGRLEANLATVSFRWQGQEVRVEARKPLAMLCYLCLNDAGSSRERLAELLWGPDRLLNVRQAIYQLRQLPGATHWLHVEELVRVEAECDVRRFEAAVEAGDFELALETWSPPLLGGIDVPRADDFREWLELERSRLEVLYLRALESRATELERAGSLEEALRLTERFLELDPFRESAYRSAMRLNYLLQRPEAAIEHYRDCLRLLREELDSEPLPDTVELAQAIRSGEPLASAYSIDHLPGELVRALQAVAVAGGRVEHSSLAAVLERSELDLAEDLAELEKRRLLNSRDGLEPAAVARTLEGVPEAVSLLLHSRFASYLEREGGEGREGEIASHWLGASRPELASGWLLKALRQALTSAREDDPLLLGFKVLWTGSDSERFEAAMLLETEAEKRGDDELQDCLLDEAGQLAWNMQRDSALARVELRRVRRSLRRRDPELALSRAEEALAIARRLDEPALLAGAFNAVGITHFFRGKLVEARDWFEKTLATSVEDERYRALNNLGAVEGLLGNLQASQAHLEGALTLARKLGRVDDVGACLNNLAATAERLADYDEAASRLREGRDLARRTGNVRNAAQTLVNIAQVHTRQGAFGPAWNTALEALEEGGRLGDERLCGQAHEQLGQVARQAGHLEEAEARFERAQEIFAELDDERKLATVRCNVALTACERGRLAASEVADVIGRLPESGQGTAARWFWAELALMTSSVKDARAYSTEVRNGPDNPHLTLLADAAQLKARLLAEERDEQLARSVSSALESVTVAEEPFIRVLLHRAGDEDQLEFARERLSDQAEGLPRRLRDSVSRQLRRWQDELSF